MSQEKENTMPVKKIRQTGRAEDLTGRRFGYLTVLNRAENKNRRTSWLCRCDCGNEKIITAHDLKAGKCRSCGCKRHAVGNHMNDLTGRKFGRLTALYPTKKRDNRGAICWRCRCDCGAETTVSGSDLTDGNCRSCGCLKRENQQKISEQLHRVDGTCLEILEKRKYRADNKSGFRGVFLTPGGKYRVSIGFKGKRFSLGTYKDYAEAVEARLEAEHLLHDGFVQSYRRWEECARQNPDWEQENPFIFDVRKDNGILCVEKSI